MNPMDQDMPQRLRTRQTPAACLVLALALAACQASIPPASSAPATSPATSSTAAPSTTPSDSPTFVSPSPIASGPIIDAVAPPQPTHPSYTFISETPSADGTESLIEYRATWEEPTGVATEFRIYELTACLREASRAADGKPCVSKGMAIPKDSLRLITTLAGDARSARITWPGAVDGLSGPGPGGVLIRAINDYGNSKFTILYSDTVCYSCVY